MIAIIHEEDQHSRSVLSEFLAGSDGLGYSTVLAAADVHEAEYLIQQNKNKISLILSTRVLSEGFDVPLARLVIAQRALDFVPFILLSNLWLPASLSRLKGDYSRIDDYLPKPFGLRVLKESVSRAYRARAQLRRSILVLGDTAATHVAEAFQNIRTLVHWKEVVHVETIEALEQKIEALGFHVGAILVDPAALDRTLVARLAKIRKSPIGALTPIAVLSRDPARIGELRLCGELFVEPADSAAWAELVSRLSRRVIHAWDARDILARGRQALKKEDTRTAVALARRGLALDSDRWEFLELAGMAAAQLRQNSDAIDFLTDALTTNPCSPGAYLQLLKLLEEPRLAQLRQDAAAYCCSHPQLREALAEGAAPHA